MDGRGNAMLVGVEHLPGLQVLRAVLPGRLQGQVRHRHQLRAAGRRHLQGGLRRGRDREAAPVRHLPADAGRPLRRARRRRAMSKVEEFEKEVKEKFVKEPGPDAAAHRGRQAADRLRRAERHLPLHRQEDAGPRPVPGHLPGQPSRRRRQGLRLHRRLPRPVQLPRRRPSPTTPVGALDGYEKKDIEGLLSDRIDKAREDLDEALEKIRALCEPVAPPKDTLQYQQYFCAESTATPSSSRPTSPSASSCTSPSPPLVARLRQPRQRDGRRRLHATPRPTAIKDEIAHYADVRDEVKLGAGEDVDFKQYEAGMRYLLDTYIQAEPSEVVADFEDTGLIELIVKLGAGAIDKLPDGHQEGPRGRRRDDHQQHAQGHHRRARDEPEVLRQDVRAARRPHRSSAARRPSTTRNTSPSCSNRPPRARQGRVRHRLSRLGQQRRPAGARRLLLPDDRARDRGRHRRHGTPSPTPGSATR